MNAQELARLVGSDWSQQPRAANLARRLALGLQHLIAGELLVAGTRLPAERSLAEAFHVSRPTVSAALAELRELGLVESRQGSGTWIAEQAAARRKPVAAMSELVFPERGINLAAATAPDASHLGSLRLSLGDLLSAPPAHGYEPVGLPELRERIAARLTRRGLPTSADELVVTNGAHHALALILGAVARASDRVIVEEHTYGGFLDLAEVARARLVPVARDDDGPRPDALDRAIRQSRPALVYLVPPIHAPTGAATSEARLRAVAEVLDRHEALVVADETLASLHRGKRAPSLATLCSAARVVTVESLSKSVWGGLRIGWIRAPRALREPILGHRARVDLGTSVAAQLVAMQVEARFDAILRARNRALRSKATQLQRQLAARLPTWSVPLPSGGLCLWARLPVDDAAPYVESAARHGVAVMAGAVARADRAPDPHIRICFDRSEKILDEAADRLAAAWIDVAQLSQAASSSSASGLT